MIIVLLLLIFSISIVFYIYIKVINNKHKSIKFKNNISGFEVARKILDKYDLNNVYITESRNRIISSYDINRKVIRLANGTFNDETVVSSIEAAKVAGYAIQDKKNDKLFQIREKSMPIVNILLIVGYIITLFGCFFGHINTIIVGLSLIDLIIVFHAFFYNVEKKATRIALIELVDNKIIIKGEYKKIDKLLKSSSYIMFASVVFPIVEIIKKIIVFGDSNK